jgi:hypothetical protein
MEARRWHTWRRCNNWDAAPPAGGSKETLHQACAQAEGGIIFFVLPHKVRSWQILLQKSEIAR